MPTLGYLPYQGWAFLFIFLKLVYKSSPSLGHCLSTAWASCAHRLGIASPTLGHCVPNIVGQDKIIG